MIEGVTIRGTCARAPLIRRTALPLMMLPLSGCSGGGAPSFEFFGAFFPAWMMCMLAGIAGAGAARMILVSPRLLGVMPYLLTVCTAVGTLVALGVWALLFR
jgi:hypothetical protein